MALCFTAEIWIRIWNVAFPVSSADTSYSLFPSDTDTHTHTLFLVVSECSVRLSHCLRIQYLSALPLDHSRTHLPPLGSTVLQECYINIAMATAGWAGVLWIEHRDDIRHPLFPGQLGTCHSPVQPKSMYPVLGKVTSESNALQYFLTP